MVWTYQVCEILLWRNIQWFIEPGNHGNQAIIELSEHPIGPVRQKTEDMYVAIYTGLWGLCRIEAGWKYTYTVPPLT